MAEKASGTDPGTRVIVVGAGPVGLMLAGELRLGGAGVVVLERLPEPTGESRASQLNSRTMEVLDQRGLVEALGGTEPTGRGHFGGLALDASRLPGRYPGYWKIPQFRTEATLRTWASGLGADIRAGREVRALAAGDDGVEVTADGPGGPLRVSGSYLVGCDGADSTVRRLAGIGMRGTAASRELLRADVAGLEIPDRRFERFENGLAIAARRGDGVTRVMLHEFGRTAARRSGPPDFAEVVSGWARITGEDISSGTPIWVDAFDDASLQATRYREGRVLLAGDSAHVQLPAGGQALNLGLQDAANLGWKLAAQACGRAPAGLLDTYHDERHPVGEQVLANVRAQAHLLLGGPEVEPVRAVMREMLALPECNDRLAATVGGLDVRYEDGGHGLVGGRMPHCDLVTGSEHTSTTRLLHPAKGVLVDLSGEDASPGGPGSPQAIAAHWGDRVRVVPAKTGSDGPLRGLGAVLLRPDGHVAWTTPDGGDLRAALSRWFGPPATT
ncbi:FAD-dependent monooxygenase [Actinomadura sp. 7K507]|uniref:FAD-dependent monooxygenase n=1 Tax=Actinomadura sp. 7K507 TaxID=2530365 RepID=UPI00104EFE75|nr:FAD-dependent monooxygenase [Actinomadura sp. 7K507]TDC97195.1 oxidoreductase [Actinomadura sp. 7K507]